MTKRRSTATGEGKALVGSLLALTISIATPYIITGASVVIQAGVRKLKKLKYIGKKQCDIVYVDKNGDPQPTGLKAWM